MSFNNDPDNFNPVQQGNEQQPYAPLPQQNNTEQPLNSSVQPQAYSGQPQQVFSQPYNNPQPQPFYNPTQGFYPPQAPFYNSVAPQPYAYPQFYPQPPIPPIVPKKEKMHGATKAFLIVFFVLLAALIAAYGVYLATELGKNSSSSDNSSGSAPNGEPIFPTMPEDDSENNSPAPANDVLNKNYAGLTLSDLPADKTDDKKYTLQNAYNNIKDSVVGIAVYDQADVGTDALSLEDVYAQGTGILLTQDGYIVTNSHVLSNSKDYYCYVVLSDGTYCPADIVGLDGRTDLAVLKIAKTGLSPADFGDYNKCNIGDDVFAVGNPGGIEFQNSLTKGIISAKERVISNSSTVKYIQTDAAINPGNSGGPLCNAYGQVIGINTIKVVSTQYEGMGFAIPSTTVKKICDDLIKNGFVQNRVKIGITGSDFAQIEQYGVTIPSGVIIMVIDEDGPLDDSNVKVNDIITKLNDTEIHSIQDIYAFLAEHKAGDKVKITFFRYDPNRRSGEYLSENIILHSDEGE
ncbi:MAG: trypsin-like peptidase domain-containing protein [Oscillospiraceae bacterium]|jgi:serine protease Do|nr:trypsin-like peptidase domain-containing protein [Oscillospiraceae bacterium]